MIIEQKNSTHERPLKRGYRTSGVDACKGNRIFPAPPNSTGIITKKIISSPWTEMERLNISGTNQIRPTETSSVRNRKESDTPHPPKESAVLKYKNATSR